MVYRFSLNTTIAGRLDNEGHPISVQIAIAHLCQLPRKSRLHRAMGWFNPKLRHWSGLSESKGQLLQEERCHEFY